MSRAEGIAVLGPREDQRRLRAFTGWLLAVGAISAAGFFAVALLYEREALAEICLGTGIFVLGVLGGRQLAGRGQTERAAKILSISLLTTVVLAAICCPFAWPALALGAVLAVALALPYLRGRALRTIQWASFAIGVAVILRGAVSGGGSSLPSSVQISVVAGGAAAALTLILLLLTDFAQRLRQALAELSQAAEESRAAYRQAAESNQTRDAIIGASPAAVVLLDVDGTVRLWNRSAERLFGWKEAEVLGAPLPNIPEHKREELRQDLKRVAEGGAVTGKETTRLDRGGEERAVEIWSAPIQHPDGTVQIVSVLIDVTDRKRTEEALRSEEENSRRAFEKARAADRRKDEFLALLGHELRNPLAPIVTALQLMQLKGDGNRRELDILDRQVQHLVRLVDDLLDVSRITRGKVRLRRERLDVAKAIGGAVEMAGPLIEERRHELSVSAPQDTLFADADPGRLAQIIANLLTNAAKYTEPEGRISIEAAREGDEIRVSVTDNGLGIEPKVLPRLFEPFDQGSRSRDHAEGGLGLGLMLVQSLIELHGGRVAAASEGLDCGSRFSVWLPSAAPLQVEQPAPRPAEQTPLPHPDRRVLVVDDNRDAAEMLADVLRLRGWEVAVAHDGPSALGVAREFRPAVAILDIGLPVMDGYELCQQLRQQASGRPIRFVAITGYGQQKDQRRSLEAGFAEHLVKPVDVKALVSALSG